MITKQNRPEPEILAELSTYASSYSFIHVLAGIAYRDFCGPIHELATRDTHDRLNYNEMALLMGLWAKNANHTQENQPIFDNSSIKHIYTLLEELHSAIFFKGIKTRKDSAKKEDIEINYGENLKEAFFYGGTGGFDLQYIKWVLKKYGKDQNWLIENKKINLEAIPDFFNHVKKTIQEKLTNSSKNHNISLESITEIFTIDRTILEDNNATYINLIDNLTIPIGKPVDFELKDVGDFNPFLEKPIIELPSRRLFIPVPYFITEALWESPYYWMASDEQYKSTAFKNRGDVAEDIVLELISELFGEKNVYKNVIVKQGKNRVTDIDILAISGNQALIFQVKSKKLTALSKKGNIISIKDDFKKAVGNAYDQAIVSKNAIINNNKFTFEVDGKNLDILEAHKYECIVALVLLDFYPAITHQTNILFDEELSETPVAISIFDLHTLTRYLDTAQKLIDYIDKRTKFSRHYRAENEMGFLGYHLRKGLSQHKKANIVYLDQTWGQSIDEMFYREISGAKPSNTPKIEKIGRNKPCPCGSGKKHKKCHWVD